MNAKVSSQAARALQLQPIRRGRLQRRQGLWGEDVGLHLLHLLLLHLLLILHIVLLLHSGLCFEATVRKPDEPCRLHGPFAWHDSALGVENILVDSR